MNILVTGATGFIGRNLTYRLAQDKRRKIICLARNPRRAESLKPLGVETLSGDITIKSSLKKILDYKIDVIYHCAAYVESKNPRQLFMVNAGGTANICELALKLKVERMIYLSSVAVVSANPQIPLTEDLPFRASNLYGESKIAAEQEVWQYRKQGLRAVVIRPCMVYGENEPHMMKFLLFLIKYRFLPLIDKGKHKFHLVYVQNVVEALLFCLNGEEVLRNAFFVADAEALTTREVFLIFSQAIGARPPLSIPDYLKPLLLNLPGLGKKLSFFSKDRVYSIERIKALGFHPPYPVRESLIQSIHSFQRKET